MSQVETFTNYGKAFQSKTIVCLIKDKLFIQQIMDILETKYFESDSDRWIVDMIKTNLNNPEQDDTRRDETTQNRPTHVNTQPAKKNQQRKPTIQNQN